MKQVKCNSCGFTDEYEPDEFGINYYQAVGTCPNCGDDLGTKEVITFEIKKDAEQTELFNR